MQATKSKKAFTILGVVLMTLAAGLFTWYEWAGGREMLNYDEVLVLKEDALEGQVIQEKNLMYQKVEKLSLIKGVIVDPAKVIGKEAKHFLPAGTQLHDGYFEENGLVLKEGQVIAQIPVEWTLSVPDTLRRGDEVVIYSAVYDKSILDALKSNVQKTEKVVSEPKEESVNDVEVVGEGGTEETTEVIITEENNVPNDFSEVLKTKVAYVKDSSNKEVITTSINGRLDASAVIRNVEIITTLEEFKRIEHKINQGGKLIVMYSNKAKAVATVEETEGE